jgi:hypothetical protein
MIAPFQEHSESKNTPRSKHLTDTLLSSYQHDTKKWLLCAFARQLSFCNDGTYHA